MTRKENEKTNKTPKKEAPVLCEAAAKIKELRESTGEKRVQFAKHVGIPIRTIDDWENGRRIPPDYIPRMIAYQLELEKLKAEMFEAKRAEALEETTNESDDEQA